MWRIKQKKTTDSDSRQEAKITDYTYNIKHCMETKKHTL